MSQTLDRCWLVNKLQQDGGGNVHSGMRPIVVRRTAALGDALAASVVADKLFERGHKVTFQTNSAAHCIMRRRRSISKVEEPEGTPDVDLDGCYENNPNRKRYHFSKMFVESANAQLARLGINIGYPDNCVPRMTVWPHEKRHYMNLLSRYPRPWVFICPRSQAYFCRTVPDDVWAAAIPSIKGTKFWIGLHPAPSGCVDLGLRHMDLIITHLACADLLISADTGPMHVAAAMGVPVLALGQSSSPELHLSDQQDFEVIWPSGLDCLNCQLNSCPKDFHQPPCQRFNPDKIAWAANRKLQYRLTENISACIAIYKPELSTLNRCLEALLPQVQEIVVAAEGDSIIPVGVNLDSKIRYVRQPARGIGYSRNMNFGVRHSSGKYLLVMNDDVFLEPNAVARMMDVIKSDSQIGLVSNLLYYPNNEGIYHSGKVRSPGVKGWSHANYRQHHPAFDKPTELENVCGACTMVPREKWFEVGALDEEFFLFSQDDAFALTMRKFGYKVYFTPHSVGLHLEHQSVNKVGPIGSLLANDNAVFNRKFGAYLDHNIENSFGNFDYIK